MAWPELQRLCIDPIRYNHAVPGHPTVEPELAQTSAHLERRLVGYWRSGWSHSGRMASARRSQSRMEAPPKAPVLRFHVQRARPAPVGQDRHDQLRPGVLLVARYRGSRDTSLLSASAPARMAWAVSPSVTANDG